ncbi:MAG: hypothetical protein KJZ69_00925 [Phycisphaerales bacterium]|nr:hypothetical protein [Phycisphaerales bacterium]
MGGMHTANLLGTLIGVSTLTIGEPSADARIDPPGTMDASSVVAAHDATEWSVPLRQQCFYSGDLDGRAGLNSQRDTFVEEAWTFDDIDWPGGTVTVAWAHYGNRNLAPVAADIAVYEGLGEGLWGTRIVEIVDITDFSWTATGRNAPGGPEYELRVNVLFRLESGHYHVGVRPVGTGARFDGAWITTTSGENSQGGPIANGNVFLQSSSLGYPLPTSWENILGPGPWDVSFGLCGDSEPGVTLALEGDCPGTMTARVGGAMPGGRVALIRSAPGGCGGQTTIPPLNPCSGTVLPLGGASLVGIITADGQGNAAVTGNVPGITCGRVCLVALDLTACEVSNVAEF